MTDLRKAAEMALARLQHTIAYSNEEMQKIDEAKHALHQALAQTEQEPVSWKCPIKNKNCKENCGSYGCGN